MHPRVRRCDGLEQPSGGGASCLVWQEASMGQALSLASSCLPWLVEAAGLASEVEEEVTLTSLGSDLC